MTFFGTTDIGLFILAGLLLNITPGADLLYITTRSATQGKKAGIVAALGISTGAIVHVLAATCGLSVILVSSSIAFTAVKYLGAAYLIYLGVTTLLSLRAKESAKTKDLSPLPLSTIFRQAILINILNPKVAIFFMALLPQFVSDKATTPAIAFLFLGLLFNVNGTIVNIVFALLTNVLTTKLKTFTRLPYLLKTLVGSLFVALGVRLAITS